MRYSLDEHVATAMICKEIGLNDKSLWIVENWGFGRFEEVMNSDNWEYKVGVYSDHRIGPFGVLSLSNRFAEQRARYEMQKHDSADLSSHLSNKSEMLANCAFEVEKQIESKIGINILDKITTENVEAGFGKLLEREV